MFRHYKRYKPEHFSIILILICTSILLINTIFQQTTATSTWQQDSDSDFQTGTLINININGTGTSAGLTLIKYDSGDWVQQAVYTYPPASMDHAMASVYGNDKVITVTKGNTWLFDLSDENWTVYKQTPKPSNRADPGLAAVFGTSKIVLFGGSSSGNLLADTWVFNASSCTWTNMKPTGSIPIARHVHRLATIYGTDKVLLFGGHLGPKNSNETWVYDLSENAWKNMKPKNCPYARNGHGMASILGTDKVLLYGGWPDNNETWLYDLSDNNWTKRSPKNDPCERTDLETATVYGTNNIVLFGGQSKTGVLSDTWVYNMTLSELKGIYISKPYDTGGNSTFKSITWAADTPNHTSVTFQLRSAAKSSSLKLQNFVGPNGAQSSYYTTPNTDIWSGHYGDRWVQYIGYLNSSKYGITPNLKKASINYNRWLSVNLVKPVNDSIMNISKPVFNWQSSDPDSNQQAAFQVVIDDDVEFNSVDYDSNEQNSSKGLWPFPSGTFYKSLTDGAWYWKVRTKDNDGDWGLYSKPWKFTVDTVAPRSTVFVPEQNRIYNNLDLITGHASEIAIGSGVASVEIIIQRLSDYSFWTGSSWNKTRTWLVADSRNAWSYDTSEVTWTSGVDYLVESRATDHAKNVEIPSDGKVFTFDLDMPKSSVVEPLDGVWVNKLDTITGNATDGNGTGIISVEIALERLEDNNFWHGDRWNATEKWLPATGSESWMYNSSNVTWSSGSKYNIRSRAIDLLFNMENPIIGTNFTYDDVPPEELSIKINDDAKFTNSTMVTLSIAAIDVHSWVTEMAFSTDSDTWSDWVTFDSTRGFELPAGDGLKYVWFKAKDYVGNIAVPVRDTIILDTTPPENLSIVINDHENFTNSRFVTLDLMAHDPGAGSGLDTCAFSFDGDTWTDWETFSTKKWINITNSDGEKYVYFNVRDLAGNIAEHVYDTIILDTQPPHSLSILINQDEPKTNSTTVLLDLKAIDNISGVSQMAFSKDGITWSAWEMFDNTKYYSISTVTGDGEKRVYFKVNDRAGNIASPVYDSITLETKIEEEENLTKNHEDKPIEDIPTDEPSEDGPVEEIPDNDHGQLDEMPNDEPVVDVAEDKTVELDVEPNINQTIDNAAIDIEPGMDIPVNDKPTDIVPIKDTGPKIPTYELMWDPTIFFITMVIIVIFILALVFRRKEDDDPDEQPNNTLSSNDKVIAISQPMVETQPDSIIRPK